MLIRFSIITHAGLEIFSFEPSNNQIRAADPQLLAGFMTAIQSFSEHIENPIQQIQFANMMLYVQTYGNFGLQLLFEERIEDEEIQRYFELMARECIPLLGDENAGNYPSEEIFKERLMPILSTLTEDPLSGTEFSQLSHSQTISKIAIVGLAGAGKTTLKNMFFENWSRDDIQNINPTIGLQIRSEFLSFLQERFVVLDFGGQAVYRDSYLDNIEIWRDLSILIFVVDIQDVKEFEKAKNYLSAIMQIAAIANEKPPKFAIFFHKCDIVQRETLSENIKKAMAYFKDFTSRSTFYLSTIDDNSGYIGLIKTIYFSLPVILLRRLLEDRFLSYFEDEILPKFTTLVKKKDFSELLGGLKSKIRESAVVSGLKYGLLMQEEWLKYLLGEWSPKSRLLSSKPLKLFKEGNFLYIEIPDYTDRDYPRELTITLIDGILDGIMKTFHLDPPEIVKDNGFFTTWSISI